MSEIHPLTADFAELKALAREILIRQRDDSGGEKIPHQEVARSIKDLNNTVHACSQQLILGSSPVVLAGLADKCTDLTGVSTKSCFNPSITRSCGQLLAVSRTSNIFPYLERKHMISDGGESPKSSINLHFINDDYTQASVHGLADTVLNEHYGHSFCGIEDARLFFWKGSLWIIGAALLLSKDNRENTRQVLCRVCLETLRIVEFVQLESPLGCSIEKNWVPVVVSDELFLIYSVWPSVIYKFSPEQGLVHVSGQAISGNEIKLRGGSPPIRSNHVGGGNGFLSIAHLPPARLGRLYYRHAFVYYNENLVPFDISEPFFILRRGIEFAAGMVDDRDCIAISFGIADQAACIARLPKDVLRHYLVHARN